MQKPETGKCKDKETERLAALSNFLLVTHKRPRWGAREITLHDSLPVSSVAQTTPRTISGGLDLMLALACDDRQKRNCQRMSVKSAILILSGN